jgi:hypothetical protein
MVSRVRTLLSRGDSFPEETGHGEPISKDWFDGFLKDLTAKFGGTTSFLRAPGQWSLAARRQD